MSKSVGVCPCWMVSLSETISKILSDHVAFMIETNPSTNYHRTLANIISANVCPTVTNGISSRSATTWNSTGAEKSMWTGCPAWHNKDESTKIKFLKTCYLFKHLLHARVNRHLSKFAHWHVLIVWKPTRKTVFTPHSF